MGRAIFLLIPQAIILWIVWGALPVAVIIAFGIAAIGLHLWRIITITAGAAAQETDASFWDTLCKKIALITCIHGALNGVIAAVCIPVAGPQ